MNPENCIVAQSGGPTAAINASLAGVIDAALSSCHYDTVYGSLHGITGILNHQFINLSQQSKNCPDFLTILKQSPAMYLGSCRFKLPSADEDDSIYQQIFHTFSTMNISVFFYIGGNDSMDTVWKLSEYGTRIQSPVRILGIPKTIDNDLCMTDHSPGFGSAAKYIAASVLEIAQDTAIYPCKSVTILEIMGRDAGWLTAASALARNSENGAPHLIYLPEVPFSREQFLEDISITLKTTDHVIIAVSEGIRDMEGNYISASSEKSDTFGHVHLNGTGKVLEHLVSDTFSIKVRSIELNILQRCAAHLASKTDLDEAFTLGYQAVKLADAKESSRMVAMERTKQNPYTIAYTSVPIHEVANAVKSVPLEWISESKNDVTPEMLTYLQPLIQGEIETFYKDGLPVFADISHLIAKSKTDQ